MGKGFGNLGGFGNMSNIMKQAQKMMEDTKKIEEELGNERVEASAGGGMVTAVASGKAELLEIKIDQQVVDPEDVEMLQDLVLSAVREAIEKANELRSERLKELTGGIGIPGLF